MTDIEVRAGLAKEKIVSIFEELTEIIVYGKEAKPGEYGHKIWLNEVNGAREPLPYSGWQPSEEKKWSQS